MEESREHLGLLSLGSRRKKVVMLRRVREPRRNVARNVFSLAAQTIIGARTRAHSHGAWKYVRVGLKRKRENARNQDFRLFPRLTPKIPLIAISKSREEYVTGPPKVLSIESSNDECTRNAAAAGKYLIGSEYFQSGEITPARLAGNLFRGRFARTINPVISKSTKN